MSIATSREEHAAAAARLQSVADEVLERERDLTHWTLAAFESEDQWHQLNEQLGEVKDLHAEEQAWIRLHAEELRRRRAQRREEDRR